MHHARAFDLEQTNPSNADSDWKKSLELWNQLYKNNDFWKDLASLIDKDISNPFPTVREKLPEQLLQIHFDIAFDENCKNYRRQKHINLALESPFSSELKEQVRLQKYKQLISHIPKAVWIDKNFNEEDLNLALETIKKYLDIDENFLEALNDLFYILKKCQDLLVVQANQIKDYSPQWHQKVNKILTLNNKYHYYIKLLKKQIIKSTKISDTFSNLIQWHRRFTQVFLKLKHNEKALFHAHEAFLIAEQNDDIKKLNEILEEWLLYTMEVAYRYASTENQENKNKARELISSAKQYENDLPPSALMIRANTWLSLQEFELVREDLTRARQDFINLQNNSNNISSNNYQQEISEIDNALNNIEKQHEQIYEYGGKESFDLYKKALQASNNNQPEKAVELMRQAKKAVTNGNYFKIDQDLAFCLDTLAVLMTNDAVDKGNRFPSLLCTTVKTTLKEAENLLREASDLVIDNSTPTNSKILQDLLYVIDRLSELYRTCGY